jgi:hypothetical protein
VNSLEERLAAAVGTRPVCWERRGGGYTANDRFTVLLDDGRRVFVKHAPAQNLAEFLRAEHRLYAALGAPYMPELLGWDDPGGHGQWPMLVLEDLSDAEWHPEWTRERVHAVRTALRQVATTPAPDWLRPAREAMDGMLDGWSVIEADPEPFLSLGICSRVWLERALPALAAAAESAPLDGGALLHLDVRSDNLCIRDGHALIVDWNWACVGNPDLDVACWLPSLACEGGPQPYEVLDDAGAFASMLAGYWGSVAGTPPPETAIPAVRDLQRRLLVVALDWARRELRLD